MSHQSLDWMHLELKLSPGPEATYQNDAPFYFNDANDVVMMGFECSQDENLTHVRYYNMYSGGTIPNFKFELWPLSQAYLGEPDESGTVLAETAAFQPSGYTGGKVAFTSPYTASQGEALGLLMKHAGDSSTINGSNYCAVKHTSGRSSELVLPFTMYSAAGGGYGNWSKQYGRYPNFAVVTNLDHDEGGFYTEGNTFPQFILDSDGDRVVNRLVVPDSNKPMVLYMNGFEYYGQGPNSNDQAIAGVWNAAGTLLGGTTFDPEQAQQYGEQVDNRLQIRFDDTVELESGETYYIGWQRVSAYFQVQALIVSYTHADEAAALEKYRSWPLKDDYRMFAWDTTDASPAFALHDLYPYSRMLIDPMIVDMHGQAAAGGGGSSIPGPSIGVIG